MFIKMKWQAYAISILAPIVLMAILYQGLINTKIQSEKLKIEQEYQLQFDKLKHNIKKLEQENKQLQEIQFLVTATMYHPTKRQCDSTPNITADGTHINVWRASDYKFIAVSRDLLNYFSYGDYVLIQGANGRDGIYQVRDTMNSRWKNRIDFLCSIGTKPFKYNKVKIQKLDRS